MESDGDMDTIREVYERAIANIPPVQVSFRMDIFKGKHEKLKHTMMYKVIANYKISKRGVFTA